jgi:light-regulated signal transduction histidine kinase (bacteriophytochrome)
MSGSLELLYPQPSTSYLFKECVITGQSNVFEYNSGTDLFMKVIMTPISEINQEITKMIFVETDISELNILKANLQSIKNSCEEQDSEIQSLADRLEFRLRTALSDIALVCASIQEDSVNVQNKAGLESMLEKVTDDVSDHLRDFNEMIALYTNKLTVVWEMVHVDEALSALLTSFGPAIGEKVKLKMVYSVPLVFRSEKQKLVKVLKLLLGNALNYSADGNVILGCEIAEGANYILFTFEHSGDMPNKVQRRGAMEYNLEIAESDAEFQLAKKLSGLLGGSVWMKTDSSEGTVVCLSFPLRKDTGLSGNETLTGI